MIFATYSVAAFAFVTIGFQPAPTDATAVYATESETADQLLSIPTIHLKAPVKSASLNGADLEVPEQIVGRYSAHQNKTLYFGHSSTIFKDLHLLQTGQEITIDGKTYTITTIEEKQKQDISMKDILAEAEKDTIVLMTCSGEKIPGTAGDHTHRLIISAEEN